MKFFGNALKVSGLFCGMVIGAGFATGEEIRLFFFDTGIFAPILSGLLYGVFCFLFLLFGKYCRENRYAKRASFVPIYFSSVTVLFAMSAAAEEILYNGFGLRFGGLITAIPSVILAYGGLKKLKNVNTFSVFAILLLVLYVFLRGNPATHHGGSIGIKNAFLYTSLNLVCGGYLVIGQGKRMEKGEMALASAITAVVLAVLLSGIYSLVIKIGGSMPFLQAAVSVGAKTAAYVVIYLAVFTTHVGATAIVLKPFRRNFFIITGLMLCLGLSTLVGFSKIVDAAYPLVGWAGIIYATYIVACLVIRLVRNTMKRNGLPLSAENGTLPVKIRE